MRHNWNNCPCPNRPHRQNRLQHRYQEGRRPHQSSLCGFSALKLSDHSAAAEIRRYIHLWPVRLQATTVNLFVS
ncbi:unnamed protein product [Linum trigynum]|uniref:Uncharacterized protein n=1 Tax=Linum trigynum TaxID=586398 RepID=A0AAV2FC00_9ROSI